MSQPIQQTALAAIRALVARHNIDNTLRLDAEQVVEQIDRLLAASPDPADDFALECSTCGRQAPGDGTAAASLVDGWINAGTEHAPAWLCPPCKPVRGRDACEACGVWVGDEYQSAPDCDATGHGVVLCAQCARAGITGALLLACADEGPCPECHRVGAHEGICAGPAAPVADDESAWVASYLACMLNPPRAKEERAHIRAEYRDRGPAEIVYHYDASGFVLRLGSCEYAISVTRVAR